MLWPDVEPINAAEPTPMADYMNRIGDPDLAFNAQRDARTKAPWWMR
jgi:hypothetical protein